MDGLTFLENINGTGNDLDNTITGNDGINTLDGRGGNDQLFGAAGNDVLIGGLGDDVLRGMDGNDTILDGVGADVIDGGADVDRVDYVLATSGVTAALDNTLTAAGGAAGDSYVSVEILAGSNFADILRGSAVANVIFGRSGDDRITGAGGPDTLTGNAGNDTFAYDSVSDSALAARDQINDFTVVAGDGTTFVDRIDLSAIDAIAGGGTANDTFAFIGTAAFTAAGQVRITALGATDTLVEVNTTAHQAPRWRSSSRTSCPPPSSTRTLCSSHGQGCRRQLRLLGHVLCLGRGRSTRKVPEPRWQRGAHQQAAAPRRDQYRPYVP